MNKKMELSDYQLWMCARIKEILKEDPLSADSQQGFHSNFEDREVISLALSEMLYRLGGLEPQIKKVN